MSIRQLLMFAFAAALTGCQSVEVRNGEVLASPEIQATWDRGWLFMNWGSDCWYAWLGSDATRRQCLETGPGTGTGPQPAVVFLHGCSGWGGRQQRVMNTIRRNGYVVFAPNSFARPGRIELCGKGSLWQKSQLRLEEAYYALARVRQLPWVDPSRLVLAGFSEGGLAAAAYPHDDVRAILILGWGCRDSIAAPRSVPVLNVVGIEDDESSTGSSLCSMIGRPTSRAVNVDAGHDIASDPKTTGIIGDFLREVLAP